MTVLDDETRVLEPGALHVIKANQCTAEELSAMQDQLRLVAPHHKFLIVCRDFEVETCPQDYTRFLLNLVSIFKHADGLDLTDDQRAEMQLKLGLLAKGVSTELIRIITAVTGSDRGIERITPKV